MERKKTWGGKRRGSGRKRIKSKGVSHKTRETFSHHHPLHINFKVQASIRNKACLKILKRAILNARKKGLRIIHFSLQSNHVHLIIEAQNNKTLTTGMRSLCVTFAKRLNLGRIQKERYHLHVLRSLKEARNAVYYVIFNQAKHLKMKKAYIDKYSSLGRIKNLKNLAKSTKMEIIYTKGLTYSFLDHEKSYKLKSILTHEST